MILQLGDDSSGTVPLVKTMRGKVVEVIHSGALAVVDSDGHLVAHAGDPDLMVCMRSSAKPFQLLPLIESGAADCLGFSERELAVMAASHSGSDAHVETVAGILERLGLDETALLCGTHRPPDREAAESLIRAGKPPSPLHHNCSGKHAGMLAAAVSQGLPIENYTDPAHPVQVRILGTLAEMADWPAERIGIGIDGCSVPVFSLPLRQAALAYARLADPGGLPEPRQSACRRIVAAMTAHPEMVAGHGRFDTALMRAGGGQIVAKGGAEGYQGVGILPAAVPNRPPAIRRGVALGLALKIQDGNGRRGTPPATLEALRQLGVLDNLRAGASAELDEFGPRPLYNYRQIPVGALSAAFELTFRGSGDPRGAQPTLSTLEPNPSALPGSSDPGSDRGSGDLQGAALTLSTLEPNPSAPPGSSDPGSDRGSGDPRGAHVTFRGSSDPQGAALTLSTLEPTL